MVLIVDDLLIGGVKFVLGKLVEAVDAELSDDSVYREELLAAQMRLELKEITPEEFAEIETDLLAKIREIKERQGVSTSATALQGDYKIEGIEVTGPEGAESENESPSRRR
jgi:hypothetical protein